MTPKYLQRLRAALIAIISLGVSYGALGKRSAPFTMDAVQDTEAAPYNSVGLLIGKRDFSSAFVIENPRLILSIAPASHHRFLDNYKWYSKSPKSNDAQTIPLRRVWIFTGQGGYASHWHKRITKLKPGFALLESYENLVTEEQVAKRSNDPYDALELQSTPKVFIGYPQPPTTYPDSESVSPLLREMKVGNLDAMELMPLKRYRNEPFMILNIRADPNTPNRFSGCEGGPLFFQNKTGEWVAAGMYSKEIQAIQADQSTLVFRILDEATYNALIKPAL